MAIGDKLAGQATAKQYSNQRANPEAFGAGISRALNGLANATENAAETAIKLQGRLQERADRTEDFQTERQYIEYIGAQNRTQAERIRGATEDATGITEVTNGALEASKEEFIKTLPVRLQEEYRTKIETFEQNTVTSAFNFEYTAGNQKFVKDVNATLNAEASEVLLGNKSADEARENIFGLIEKSDLDEPAKRDLQDQAETFLLKAEYQKEVEYAVEFQGTVEPKTEGDVVAAGLLPHERGILNAIASPESSDQYDVMYSGKKFTDFSDHPREYITITSGPNKGKKSSAAGKYQFLASTWDATVREYNTQNPERPISNFSPESQDRIAIFYARKIYNRQQGPGEATFDQVLTSGNRDMIISMKSALTDDKGGWEGFRHMSDDAFANIILGGKGIRGGGTGAPGAPDIWENPKYANLSFGEKNDLSNYAAKAVADRNAGAAYDAKRRQEALTEEAMLQAVLGQNTLGDLDKQIKAGRLTTAAEISKWQGLVESANKGKSDMARVSASLAAGKNLYASDDKGFNLLLGEQGKTALREEDSDYAAQVLLPAVNTAGFFPSDTAEQLNSMVLSSNQRAREYATGILSSAASVDPRVLDRSPGLSEKAKQQIMFTNALRNLYTPAETAEILRNANDPQQAQTLDILRKEGAKLFEKNYDLDDMVAAFDTWIPGDAPQAPMTVGQAAVFQQDYQTAFVEGYARTQDEDASREYADQMVKRIYSPSTIGGSSRLTKYPPETFYPALDGNHDWIDQQLRNEMEFGSEVQFQLIPDAQTAMEGKRYNSSKDKTGMNNASYQVGFINDKGLPELKLGEDGKPIRWAGEITETMKRRAELLSDYTNADATAIALAKTADLEGKRTPENQRLFEVAKQNATELKEQLDGQGVVPNASVNTADVKARIAKLENALGPNPKSDFAGSQNDRMMKELDLLRQKLENN